MKIKKLVEFILSRVIYFLHFYWPRKIGPKKHEDKVAVIKFCWGCNNFSYIFFHCISMDGHPEYAKPYNESYQKESVKRETCDSKEKYGSFQEEGLRTKIFKPSAKLFLKEIKNEQINLALVE